MIIDGVFSAGFDVWGALALALAWLPVVGLALTLAMGRLVGVAAPIGSGRRA